MARKHKQNGQSSNSISRIYQVVTDQIVEALEAGKIPWQAHWKRLPDQNFVSQRCYRGLNVLALWVTSMVKGYATPYWLTFNQVKQLGGSVGKGERSTPIVFWRWYGDEDQVQAEEGEEDRDQAERPHAVAAYYRVFNYQQCAGLPAIDIDTEPAFPSGAELIQQYLAREDIPLKTGRMPAYAPKSDTITMPPLRYFESEAYYCSTQYHEAVHSTGHPSRLARFEVDADDALFGSESYAKEELVAGIGAAMLCAATGLDHDPIPDAAAYCQGWLERLNDDRLFLVSAAQQAQKAVDYILAYQEQFSEGGE